jgi:hypothetical protein
MKAIINILVFILIQINICSALTTKTWTGSTNNDFNTSTNWEPNGVPSTADSCIISISTSRTITLSSSITIGALSMIVSGNNNSLILNVSTNLLVIKGNLHTKAISGNTNTFVRLNCGGSPGGVVIERDAFFDDGGTRTSNVISNQNSPGFLKFKGNATFGTNTHTSPLLEPDIIFDGIGTQTVSINNTVSYFYAENLIIGITNNPTINLTGTSLNGFGCYDGNVSINGTSILDLGNHTINRNSSGGTFTLAENAILRLSHNTGGRAGSNFPNNFSTYALSNSSVVEYYRAGNQTIYGTTYGNIIITGTGTKTLGANTTITGNWENNGTFAHGNFNVTFSGSENKTIGGSSSTNFHNIIVNKGSDTTYHVEAISEMSVMGHLTLTNGVLKLTHTSSSAQFNTTAIIASTAGLWVNGGSFTSGHHTTTNLGLLRVEYGTVSLGNSITGNMTFSYGSNSLLEIKNEGILSVASGLSIYDSGNFKMTGGTLVLARIGANINDKSFWISENAKLFWSGGSIISQNKNNYAEGWEFYIESGSGEKYITGGTYQVGNESTPASSIFRIYSQVPIHNLTINSTNSPIVQLKGVGLMINNHLTIQGGVLDASTNNLDITLGGYFTNNSSVISNGNYGYDPGISTFTFNGSDEQSINGTEVTTFYNLTNYKAFNKIKLNQDISVKNILDMSGNSDIDLNGYNIDLGMTGLLIGESNTDRIYDTQGVVDVSGMITATRILNAPSAVNVAGLGAVLTSSANLGLTEIKRGHLTHEVLNDNIGIKRYYSITPTTNIGLNATFAFNYFENELNGNAESNLTLWRSTDVTNPDNWINRDGAVDVGVKTITLTEIDAFSTWTAADADNSPLPITLTSFDAQPISNKVLLTWTTLSEQNNDYFTIEKTLDGINFEKVGTIKGAGNSSSKQNYSLYDYKPYNGLSYYRLKQTDYDGVSKSFNLITVEFISTEISFSFETYPNPLTNNSDLIIYYKGKNNSNVNIQIHDILGKLIYSSNKYVNYVEEIIIINAFTELSTGQYSITLTNGVEKINKKIIISGN